MNRIAFTEKEGDFEVSALVDRVGEDVLVLLTGGQPHVGAIAVAQPRPSRTDPRKSSSTASVFAVLGHKEDAVAKKAAEDLSSKLGRTVVMVAGLHWDALSADDISVVAGMCNRLIGRVAGAINSRNGGR